MVIGRNGFYNLVLWSFTFQWPWCQAKLAAPLRGMCFLNGSFASCCIFGSSFTWTRTDTAAMQGTLSAKKGHRREPKEALFSALWLPLNWCRNRSVVFQVILCLLLQPNFQPSYREHLLWSEGCPGVSVKRVSLSWSKRRENIPHPPFKIM